MAGTMLRCREVRYRTFDENALVIGCYDVDFPDVSTVGMSISPLRSRVTLNGHDLNQANFWASCNSDAASACCDHNLPILDPRRVNRQRNVRRAARGLTVVCVE